mmetsp:Transcript_24304/g.69884  ORF Transcript_24304/g.69884 Transcript_24304/m.69884 type:complete len:271 (-) Transcript_24304:47-859(-)
MTVNEPPPLLFRLLIEDRHNGFSIRTIVPRSFRSLLSRQSSAECASGRKYQRRPRALQSLQASGVLFTQGRSISISLKLRFFFRQLGEALGQGSPIDGMPTLQGPFNASGEGTMPSVSIPSSNERVLPPRSNPYFALHWQRRLLRTPSCRRSASKVKHAVGWKEHALPDICVLFEGVFLFKPLREAPPLGALLMSETTLPAPSNVLGVRTWRTSDVRRERKWLPPPSFYSHHSVQCQHQGVTGGREARRSYFSPLFVCRRRRSATTTILR